MDELTIHKLKEGTYLERIYASNHYSSQFNLSLSKADIIELQESRKLVLKETERLELGDGILDKLILAVADSPYIHQDNYVYTLDRLQGMFYYYKSEIDQILADDDLIGFMAEHFNKTCGGSLEHLEETILDAFFRELRQGCGYE